MIPSLQIYYFSGTGNSKHVALLLAEEAKAKQMEVHLINLASTDRKHIPAPPPESMLAFVSPVHGFNYPPVMLHFIFRFPRGKNKVLLLNTRAGMLIGKFITPGLSGISLYLAALVLFLKGFSIRAMFPIDLPSNWISLHPGLNKATVDYLHLKNRERIVTFANRVFSGRPDFRSLREIIQDLLVAPIALGYYLVGRFLIAKTFYASQDCDNCGLCSKTCPIQAIKTIDKRPYWTYNCESCMHCMNYCPKRAIETAHGMIILFVLLFNMLLIGLFYSYIETFFFPIKSELLRFILESGLMLLLLGIWYRIFHFLLRYKWFERVVLYTSLTKLKFWSRYKGKKM